jgi:predicted Zn-dependent protease
MSSTVFATAYIHSPYWDLVNGGKHLVWFDNTQYDPYFSDAVSKWNSYKSGVIQKTNSTASCTAMVQDYYTVDNIGGYTSAGGYIYLNRYNIDRIPGNHSRSVCVHELGHALGLSHNPNNASVYMYATAPSSFGVLTQDDKDSYNQAYTHY